MIGELVKMQMEFTVPLDGDTWKFKLLRPVKKMHRASLVSEYLNGTQIDKVSADDYNIAFILATLQLAHVPDSGPKEFYSDFDGEYRNIDDFDVALQLFEKYTEKETEFENRKKKPRHNEGSEKKQVDNTRPPM